MDPRKSKCTLIIDGSREHQITIHDKTLSSINTIKSTITTGDYVIMSPNNEYLAVIERKSLEDYAASIKDDRIRNTQKMVELRRKTGCKIIYLVEGKDMRPEEIIGRTKMQYRWIESNMFHQIVRDGICVLRTRDSLDTAETLVRFVQSMDTLVAKTDIADMTQQIPEIFTPIDPAEPLSLLKVQHVKTDHAIVCEMWGCFAGITAESADEYNRIWSIADIVCGRVVRPDIENFKLSSGRKIGKKAKASLMSVSKSMESKLLSKIPGISSVTANQLTSERPLSQLLSYSVGALSICKVGKTQKNLGDARAKRILDLFSYRYVANKGNETNDVANEEANEAKTINNEVNTNNAINNVINTNKKLSKKPPTLKTVKRSGASKKKINSETNCNILDI